MPAVYNSAMYYAPSAWKIWIDHVMKQKQMIGVEKAAIVRQNGTTASATCGFVLSESDVRRVNQFFNNPSAYDRINIRNKTYMVKSSDATHLIAFTGAKYLIIFRSKTMYIVAKCNVREKTEEAVRFFNVLNRQLQAKNYWCGYVIRCLYFSERCLIMHLSKGIMYTFQYIPFFTCYRSQVHYLLHKAMGSFKYAKAPWHVVCGSCSYISISMR